MCNPFGVSFWWRAHGVPISARWLVHEAFEPRFQIVRLLYTRRHASRSAIFPQAGYLCALRRLLPPKAVGRWIIAFTSRSNEYWCACVEAARKVNHALPVLFVRVFPPLFPLECVRSTPSHGRIGIDWKGIVYLRWNCALLFARSAILISFWKLEEWYLRFFFFFFCALKSYIIWDFCT